MNDSKKMRICPLMTRVVFQPQIQEGQLHPVPCQEPGCELWVDWPVYSTEGMRQPARCAFVIQAVTDKDGKVVV
jgi:hypothetical protein